MNIPATKNSLLVSCTCSSSITKETIERCQSELKRLFENDQDILFSSSETSLCTILLFIFSRRFRCSDLSKINYNVDKSNEFNKKLDKLLKGISKDVSHLNLECCLDADMVSRDPYVRQQLFQFIFSILKQKKELIQEEYESYKALFIKGITDVWSDTRRKCTKELRELKNYPWLLDARYLNDFLLSLNSILKKSTCWKQKEGALCAFTQIFMSVEIECPSSLIASIKESCLKLLTNDQKTVRKFAVNLIVIQLKSKSNNACSWWEMFSHVTEKLEVGTLTAFHAESLLWLAEELLGVDLGSISGGEERSIVNFPQMLFDSLLKLYLGHEASSVRQQCSSVITKVILWKANTGETVSKYLLKLTEEHKNQNWRYKEGQLMSMELILREYQNSRSKDNSVTSRLFEQASLVSFLGNVLHQVSMGTTSPEFEVRRVSLQVLPLITDTICDYKPGFMTQFVWNKPSNFAASTFRLSIKCLEKKVKVGGMISLRHALVSALAMVDGYLDQMVRYENIEQFTSRAYWITLSIENLMLSYSHLDVNPVWGRKDIQQKHFEAIENILRMILSADAEERSFSTVPFPSTGQEQSNNGVCGYQTRYTTFSNAIHHCIMTVCQLLPKFCSKFPRDYCMKIIAIIIAKGEIFLDTQTLITILKALSNYSAELKGCTESSETFAVLRETMYHLQKLVINFASYDVKKESMILLQKIAGIHIDYFKIFLETLIFLDESSQIRIPSNGYDNNNKKSKNVEEGSKDPSGNPCTSLEGTGSCEEESDWDSESEPEDNTIEVELIANACLSLFKHYQQSRRKETATTELIPILGKLGISNEFSQCELERIQRICSI